MKDRPPEYLLSMHHVAFSVPDFEASVAWWERMLGFAVEWMDKTPSGGRVAFLSRQDVGVELFSVLGAQPLAQERLSFDTHWNAHGMIHFSLTVDDVAGLVADLRGKGVDIVRDIDVHPLGKIAFIKDNSGNLLELFELHGTTPEAAEFRESHRAV